MRHLGGGDEMQDLLLLYGALISSVYYQVYKEVMILVNMFLIIFAILSCYEKFDNLIVKNVCKIVHYNLHVVFA